MKKIYQNLKVKLTESRKESMKRTRKEQKRQDIENAESHEDGMTVDEVAKILEMTPHAVRRIEKIALGKLKAPNDKNKKLHKYYSTHLRPTDVDYEG